MNDIPEDTASFGDTRLTTSPSREIRREVVDGVTWLRFPETPVPATELVPPHGALEIEGNTRVTGFIPDNMDICVVSGFLEIDATGIGQGVLLRTKDVTGGSIDETTRTRSAFFQGERTEEDQTFVFEEIRPFDIAIRFRGDKHTTDEGTFDQGRLEGLELTVMSSGGIFYSGHTAPQSMLAARRDCIVDGAIGVGNTINCAGKVVAREVGARSVITSFQPAYIYGIVEHDVVVTTAKGIGAAGEIGERTALVTQGAVALAYEQLKKFDKGGARFSLSAKKGVTGAPDGFDRVLQGESQRPLVSSRFVKDELFAEFCAELETIEKEGGHRTSIEDFLRRCGDKLGEESNARHHFFICAVALRVGLLGVAEEHERTICELDPEDPLVRLFQAQWKLVQGKLVEAKSELTAARILGEDKDLYEADPNHALFLSHEDFLKKMNWLAGITEALEGHDQEAISYLQAASLSDEEIETELIPFIYTIGCEFVLDSPGLVEQLEGIARSTMQAHESGKKGEEIRLLCAAFSIVARERRQHEIPQDLRDLFNEGVTKMKDVIISGPTRQIVRDAQRCLSAQI